MEFKDLQEGDKFIAQPSDEDDLTSNKPFYIFIKIASVEFDYLDNMVNAVRLRDGSLSNMPGGMLVVHIE